MTGFIDKIRQKMSDQKKKAIIKAIKDKGNKYTDSNSQHIVTSSETVVFNTKNSKLIEEVRKEVALINEKANLSVEYLLNYVREHGTCVYKISNAAKVLAKINEHTGFITELEGTKAAYINTITGNRVALKSDSMFIVDENKPVDYYMLLREFYIWYSYTKGLAGFDFKSQEIFKKYMNNKNNPELSKLDYSGNIALQESLARDTEANNFVMEYVRHKDGGANVIKKMQDGGASI